MKIHFARRLRRLKIVTSNDGRLGAIFYAVKWLLNNLWYRMRFVVLFILCDRRGLPILFLKYRHTKPIDNSLTKFGNYFLVNEEFDENSIVYSFGIGRNITFDRAVVERYGCTVFAFDPTPLAIEFMSSVTNPKIVFTPVGAWTEDKQLNFTIIRSETGQIASGSLTNVHGFKDAETYPVEVRCLQTLMKERGHDCIDIIKMDIEGAGIPVMRQALEQNILPRQIVAEFEGPAKAGPAFWKELNELLVSLNRAGYEMFSMPARMAGMNFSIELIAQLKSSRDQGAEN